MRSSPDPRIYASPSTPEQAAAQISGWLDAPSMVLIGESEGYRDLVEPLLRVAG